MQDNMIYFSDEGSIQSGGLESRCGSGISVGDRDASR
jgi:hypothetical protein